MFLVPVSPPDRHGYCSFGPGVWLSGTLARNANLVIAEVHEDFIRTGGENYIRLDQTRRAGRGRRRRPARAARRP